MEFINTLDEEGEEDIDLEEVADEIYRSTLYTFQLPKEEPTEDTNILELTAIGKGIKSIINDTNFDTLYIYIREKLNDDLCELVSVQLDSKCNIVFLTGVGKAWPIIRSHTILNNLHRIVEKQPLIMFFPGTYDGGSLMLFNYLKDDNYYRAFQLIDKY